MILRPFWRYFGAKWRAAPHYPAPRHATIIEPFAGAAGYSLRHAERAVILVERDPAVAEVWRWLIGSSPADLRAIPLVECVDDLPASTPQGARLLVGFGFGAGDSRPRRRMSPMIRRDGGLFVPHGATTVRAGDVLTLIGTRDAIIDATTLFERA